MFGKYNCSYSNYKAGLGRYRPTRDDHKHGFGLCPWDINACNDKDSLGFAILPKSRGILGEYKSAILYFPKTSLLGWKSSSLTDTCTTLMERGAWSTVINSRYEQRELEESYYNEIRRRTAMNDTKQLPDDAIYIREQDLEDPWMDD